MNSSVPLPHNKLSKDAVKVWLISDAIGNVIGLVVLAVLLYLDSRYDWKPWIGWILIGLTILFVLGTLWSLVHPYLMHRSWRYGVTEEFLQLQSGVWIEQYQLVPMTKIQAVSTEQGPILRKYGLYSVSVTTMGSSHTIPALTKETAEQLRNTIALYAKIKEVES